MLASLGVRQSLLPHPDVEPILPDVASRPSHYVLMHNDLKLRQHDVEELSYYLCHVHQGASCSVSIPTPIYCEW